MSKLWRSVASLKWYVFRPAEVCELTSASVIVSQLSNYALNVHLRGFQAGTTNALLQRFHPDVF